MRKPNVLFLCSGNSARSQMAEALLRKHAGDLFDVASAGTDPQRVNPLTFRALEEIDVPTDDLRFKSVGEFFGRTPIRYLIVLCPEAEKACPKIWPGVIERLFWPFDDPAAVTGLDETRLAAFRTVRGEIEAQIVAWLGATPRGETVEAAEMARF